MKFPTERLPILDDCFNCQRITGPGVPAKNDACKAAPKLDGSGNPLDDCATAKLLGLDLIPIGAGISVHALGVVICKDGVEIVCTYPEEFRSITGNPDPITDFIKQCLIAHEEWHKNSDPTTVPCERCGWGQSQTTDKDRSECGAYQETLRCMIGKSPRTSTDEAFITWVRLQIAKYCHTP